MKNNKKYIPQESRLLEEIIRTYRYPDGTLNKIAVFISALALMLVLVLGNFVVTGIKNLTHMGSVSASELTVDEIKDYITDAYIQAIDDYYKGDLDEEAAKKRILSFLADYLSSSSAFTDAQKTEIMESISQYFTEMSLQDFITDSTSSIEKINSTLETYIKDNEHSLEAIKTSLQNEIANNKTLSDTELSTLKELYDKISKLEANDFNQVNNYINDVQNELSKNITDNHNSFITKLYDGIEQWNKDNSYQKGDYVLYDNNLYKNISGENGATTPDKDATNWQSASILTYMNDLEGRVSHLENAITAEDNAEFQFGFKDGSYGYIIDDVFYPF